MSLWKNITTVLGAPAQLGSGLFFELESGNRNREGNTAVNASVLTATQQTASTQTQQQIIQLETIRQVLLYSFLLLVIGYLLYSFVL